MNARLPHIMPRLKQLLLMLSSSAPGEIVAAAHAITRTLQGAGADWHDLAARLSAPPEPHSRDDDDDWREICRYCLEREELLHPREFEFLYSLRQWRRSPSEKQFAWLMSIYRRLKI